MGIASEDQSQCPWSWEHITGESPCPLAPVPPLRPSATYQGDHSMLPIRPSRPIKVLSMSTSNGTPTTPVPCSSWFRVLIHHHPPAAAECQADVGTPSAALRGGYWARATRATALGVAQKTSYVPLKFSWPKLVAHGRAAQFCPAQPRAWGILLRCTPALSLALSFLLARCLSLGAPHSLMSKPLTHD